MLGKYEKLRNYWKIFKGKLELVNSILCEHEFEVEEKSGGKE